MIDKWASSDCSCNKAQLSLCSHTSLPSLYIRLCRESDSINHGTRRLFTSSSAPSSVSANISNWNGLLLPVLHFRGAAIFANPMAKLRYTFYTLKKKPISVRLMGNFARSTAMTLRRSTSRRSGRNKCPKYMTDISKIPHFDILRNVHAKLRKIRTCCTCAMCPITFHE